MSRGKKMMEVTFLPQLMLLLHSAHTPHPWPGNGMMAGCFLGDPGVPFPRGSAGPLCDLTRSNLLFVATFISTDRRPTSSSLSMGPTRMGICCLLRLGMAPAAVGLGL